MLPQVGMEVTEENNREPRECSCGNQTNLWASKFLFQSQAIGNLAVEQTRQCSCQSVPDKRQGQEKSLSKKRRKRCLAALLGTKVAAAPARFC